MYRPKNRYYTIVTELDMYKSCNSEQFRYFDSSVIWMWGIVHEFYVTIIATYWETSVILVGLAASH